MKRGCCNGMKRAEACKSTSSFFKSHILSDHLYDICGGTDLIFFLIRNHSKMIPKLSPGKKYMSFPTNKHKALAIKLNDGIFHEISETAISKLKRSFR